MSCNKVIVFTVDEMLEAIKNNPDVLKLERKKTDKVYKGNTYYLTASWNIDGSWRPGWFTLKDVQATVVKTKSHDGESKSGDGNPPMTQIKIRKSQCPQLIEMMTCIDEMFKKQVDKLAKEKKISINKRSIRDMLQTRYSENTSAKDENGRSLANEPLEDPIVYIKLEPGTWSTTNRFLGAVEGQPIVKILDYRKKRIVNGQVGYERAMITNPDGTETPVTVENLDKFMTPGSIIHGGRFLFKDMAVTSSWITMPVVARTLIIEPAPDEVMFSDGILELDNNASLVEDATADDPALSPEKTEDDITADEVARMLDGDE